MALYCSRLLIMPLEMSTAYRLLSYGFLSLITSTPIAGRTPAPGLREEEEEDEISSSTKGLLNSEGAWCWKEDCEGELNPPATLWELIVPKSA
jgi:hypothetical protein